MVCTIVLTEYCRYCCINFTLDINECATNMGGCQQACVNTPGGFHCTCNPGFTLNSDGITCTGTVASLFSKYVSLVMQL